MKFRTMEVSVLKLTEQTKIESCSKNWKCVHVWKRGMGLPIGGIVNSYFAVCRMWRKRPYIVTLVTHTVVGATVTNLAAVTLSFANLHRFISIMIELSSLSDDNKSTLQTVSLTWIHLNNSISLKLSLRLIESISLVC